MISLGFMMGPPEPWSKPWILSLGTHPDPLGNQENDMDDKDELLPEAGPERCFLRSVC